MYYVNFEEMKRFEKIIRELGFINSVEDMYRSENLVDYYPLEEIVTAFEIASKKKIFSIDYVVGILNKREEKRLNGIKLSNGETFSEKLKSIVKSSNDRERQLEDEKLKCLGMERHELNKDSYANLEERERFVWEFYKRQLKLGYFKEYDEDGFEDYTDKHIFERALEHYGFIDGIKVIEYNKMIGNAFNTSNLMYVYDWMDWRGVKING